MAEQLSPAEVASLLLKGSSLLAVLLLGGPLTSPNNYPPVASGPYWTLLDVTHTVLLLVSAGLAGTRGGWGLNQGDFPKCLSAPVLRQSTSDFAMALSLALLVLLLRLRWRRCLPPSGFAAMLLGLLFTASVLDAFTQLTSAAKIQDINMSAANIDKEIMIVSLALVVTTAGNFLFSEVQDLVLKRRPSSGKQKDEDTSSVFGRQACVAIFPMLRDAVRKGQAAAPLLLLRRGLRCTGLVEAITSRLQAHRTSSGNRRTFLVTMLRVLWVDVLRIALCSAAYFACLFARIPAMELLINAESGTNITTAVLLFMATTTMELLVSCCQMDVAQLFGSRARSMFLGLIFNKVTVMSAGSKARYPAGHITSILGVDCSILSTAAINVPTPLFGAVFLPFIFWMLAARAGVAPSMCCAAWLLLILCLPFLSSCIQRRFWSQAIRARDERLKATSDLLSTIRVVKMYAWEEAMQENVLCARETELKWLFRINLLDAILDSVYSSTSSVLTIILFVTLSLLEPDVELTPAQSFSCVSLLSMTDLTMNTCGQAIRNFSQAMLAMKRIADFCTADKQQERNSCSNRLLPSREGAVVMRECSFSWTPVDETAQLTDIDLDIAPGSLVGVVGFVGSGKSSLLAAILGDLHRIKGDFKCTGRIAFVPQLPNVHNMTIRDNILYGQYMDNARYERAIRCCQLMNDINKLHSGDMTEVGEKGTNLSGGQKQRISLARAVYSESDVYLLDDPLSALDPVVGSLVFRDVIGKEGLLKNKTRIMVCNQGHYLYQMDKLIVVDGKRMRAYDKVQDVLRDPEMPQTLRAAIDNPTSQLFSNSSTSDDQMDQNDTVGRITEEELGERKKTAWKLLRHLLQLSGWPALVGVLAFLGSAFAFSMQQLTIKKWTDATGASSENSSGQRHAWMEVLVSWCVMDVVLRIAGSVLLALTAERLSRTLHTDMLSHVLHSPVSFFDGSPRGRVLNRFSADMEVMDARTFLSGKQSLQNTMLMFAKIAVVGTQSSITLALSAIVTVLAGFGMDVAVKASHCASYAKSISMSRLLQHAGETLDALSTVRAYGVAGRFRRHFCRLTDDVARGCNAFSATYRFTRTLTSTAGFLVVVCTLAATIVSAGPHGPEPSSLGLALSSATSVPVSLLTLCVMLFNVLQMVVSFERCLEYTELPPEEDLPKTRKRESEAQPTDTLSKWPSQGKVEFNNYSASYRPGVLPDVLSGVTFLVRPAEKVGVVGRTGAGKSSLVLALLRMLRASQGRILIDDVDIAGVPLPVLRRSITVIPQDPSLVRGTLRMNLDPTNSHSDQEIWQCIERANLETMVSNNAKGLLLETADGGANLSVGQRQLVCLVRAFLRGNKILVLDEATSQMDGDTDRLIQVALRNVFSHCTLFTIAHRIHTILDYDRILVMDEGKVLEFDTVPRLLSDPSSAFYKLAHDAGINGVRDSSAVISMT